MLWLLLKICVQFQAFKNLYPTKKEENIGRFEKIEKKCFGFWKKKFWLQYRYQNWTLVRFPIPKPGFSRTLTRYFQKYQLQYLNQLLLFPTQITTKMNILVQPSVKSFLRINGHSRSFRAYATWCTALLLQVWLGK